MRVPIRQQHRIRHDRGAQRPFGLLIGALCVCALPAAGQGPPAKAEHLTRPRFTAEVTSCVEADSSYIHLHVEIPYSQLSFRKSGGGMEAAYDLIVHILQNDRQIKADLWPERVRVGSRAELYGRESRVRKDLAFALPPGRYVFEVQVAEPGSGQSGLLRLESNLPFRLPGRLAVSSLLVGGCDLVGGIGALRRNPAIQGVYAEVRDTLCAYLEVYHPELAGAPLRLKWRLVGSNQEIAAEGEGSGRAKGDQTRLSWQVPVKDLWIDDYVLEAVVGAGEQQANAAARVSLMGESEPALSGFFLESLEALAYIASEEEMQKLRMAPPRDRRRAWDAFWRRRDPTPEDARNENKEAFFRRLRHVNEAFASTRPGWRTDRGKVYIIHGPPDQVSRTSYITRAWPAEVWHYDQLGLEFIFVDRHGYGDFELVQPGW